MIASNLLNMTLSQTLKQMGARPTQISKMTAMFRMQTGFSNKENIRFYTAQPPQKSPGFLGKVYDNLKDEMERNQKFKDSFEEFKQEKKSMEESEFLKKAKEKYKKIEEETSDGTDKAIQHLQSLREKVVQEAQKTEILKAASRATEEAGKQAQKVGQTIAEKGEQFAQTQTYKRIQDTAKIVKEEIDHSTFGRGARVYRRPTTLRLRSQRDAEAEAKIIEANTEATGVVLHKDSKFSQSWQDFKNNNAYVGKVLEWRAKLDESENPVIRASLLLKEKASEILGGLFEKTDLSVTLTEICTIDPNFDKERFLLECEYFIIPNILEAIIRPDLKVLEDWCYERAYQVLAAPAKQALQLGFHFDSKVLDVDQVDLVMGKVLDEGPVLAVSFQSQQILCVRNRNGDVVEGDPNKILRVSYVWVLCRDQTDLCPSSAWRLLDLSAQSAEQLL